LSTVELGSPVNLLSKGELTNRVDVYMKYINVRVNKRVKSQNTRSKILYVMKGSRRSCSFSTKVCWYRVLSFKPIYCHFMPENEDILDT